MQGKTISGYTIQSLLGKGGMAEVWLAENKIGKKAAVKLMLPKFCDEASIVERFENEAKVMVQLEHPYIRQVYDYDLLENRPCILMEYLEGDDLKAMMKQGHRFSEQELEKWWNQMAQALNYTHSLGIVHRDIKPSNIFIDRYGNVRLLDFGIAKNNEGGSGTLTGSTLGTRIYMSPEQVKDPKRVDYRTDLYSLAVTFVHLITGKKPYDSDTSSDFEIQMNIVTKPLDLSALPDSWKSFLEPYLEKDPEKRPALREFENQQPIAQPIAIEIVPDDEEGTVVETDVNKKQGEVKEQFVHNEPVVRVGQPGDLVNTVNGVSFAMKRVEGGAFHMGSHNSLKSNLPNYDSNADSDESPVHEVRLSTFYLGEMEVTKRLYDAVMDCETVMDANLPKSNVSWNDCQKMIEKLNSLTGRHFRLPTEAEWEYAARGGRYNNGFTYSGSYDADEVAWHAENSSYAPHPVGQKHPNQLGLYDMSGNMEEWCEDRFGEYTSQSQTNPRGADSGNYRVLRGGCWGFVKQRCRVSNRECANVDARSGCYGFRLALSE